MKLIAASGPNGSCAGPRLFEMPLYRFMRDYDHNLARHYLLGGALIGAISGLSLLVVGLPKLSIGIFVPVK